MQRPAQGQKTAVLLVLLQPSGQHASLPPEADRKADRQRLNIVPVLGRDVQHVAGLQHTLQVHGVAKLGELVQVGPLAVHLAGVSQETGGVRVEMLGELRRVEPHVLLPHHLAQKVVFGVLVEGGHGTFGPNHALMSTSSSSPRQQYTGMLMSSFSSEICSEKRKKKVDNDNLLAILQFRDLQQQQQQK